MHFIEKFNYVLNKHGEKICRDTHYEEWFHSRRNCLTSSDAVKLLSKKFDPVKIADFKKKTNFSQYVNPSMHHGNTREPEILKTLQKRHHIEPNGNILHKPGNMQLACTPDAVGDNMVVEVKASKFNLDEVVAKYYPQIQWHLFVTETVECLFAVETHKNFADFRLEERIIKPDWDVFSIFTEKSEQVLQLLIPTPNSSDPFLETVSGEKPPHPVDDDVEW